MAAPNADKILTAYLNAQIAERVVGKTPSQIQDPWVRVTVIDDPSIHGGIVDHSIEAYVQIDCFAGKDGNQGTAKELSLEVRQVLHATNETPVSAGGGYIVGANVSFSRADDPTFEPAMEGYRGVGTVWMRS